MLLSEQYIIKKSITCIAILLIIATDLNAQKILFGLGAGLGDSWITKQDGDNKFNTAWNAGLSLIYSTKSHFVLGANIKYSTEGNKKKYKTPGPADGLIDVTNTINANYIRIPFKLIYFFGKYGSSIQPKIYAGPDFGFFIGGKNIANYSGYKVIGNSKDQIKSFDVGAIIAAGINFKLAPCTWLNTDLAYYNGFANVSKGSNNNHNRNIELNVGLLVDLKKK